MTKKLFVVKKYVMASCAAEALRIEKRQRADDVWVDDDWKKTQPDAAAGVMGFMPKRRKARNAKKNQF